MNFLKLNINNIKKIYFERDYSFLVLSLSLFLLPLSINLSTFTLVCALFLKLIQILFLKQRLFKVKSLKMSSKLGLFFLVYVLIDSIAQNNFQYTLSVFEVEFSHLVLLVLIPLLIRNKGENIVLSNFFFFGLIIACVYVFIKSVVLQISFNRDAFESILDIHHTYLSMYILFFVNYLLNQYFINPKRNNYLKNIIFIASISLLFSIIFVLNSKVSVVIFAILLGGYLINSFSKKNALRYFLIFSILLFSLFLFNKKLSVNYKSTLDFRLEIWEQSLNSIKEYPLFGNLKMQEKDILNLKHFESGKYYLMDSDLNSHNQYLSILLKYGIIGFLILAFYPINLINALNKSTTKDTIRGIMGFTAVLLIIFYIENVLDRHHGIVFFSVFYNYYLAAFQNEDI